MQRQAASSSHWEEVILVERDLVKLHAIRRDPKPKRPGFALGREADGRLAGVYKLGDVSGPSGTPVAWAHGRARCIGMPRAMSEVVGPPATRDCCGVFSTDWAIREERCR